MIQVEAYILASDDGIRLEAKRLEEVVCPATEWETSTDVKMALSGTALSLGNTHQCFRADAL
jgi:hypothetical protein